MERVIKDMNNTELNIGDSVCFVTNQRRGWRQSPEMVTKKISNIICGNKSEWLILEDYDHKVSPNRVVKVIEL